MNMNKSLYSVFICLLSYYSHPLLAKGTDFDVNAMPVSDAVSLIWNQVLNKPFMLSPDLQNDPRKLTLHISPLNDERDFIVRYLDNMHIRVTTKNGIDYITPYEVIKAPVKLYTFTYKPKYRDVAYISSVLNMSLNQGVPALSSSGSPASQSSADNASQSFMSSSGNVFVYRGTKQDIDNIKAVMPEIDIRAEQVNVTVYVYEVSSDERNGSGLALAAKLLNSHFKLNIGTRPGYGNFIQFSAGSLDAIYELFRTDNRFSLVNAQHLRVESGKNSVFTKGSSVPTIGSVSYQDGTPVQSVEYRNTGITFQVTPVLTDNLISMSINEQLSDFAETTTGVNNTPTFSNRQISTSVNMNDGDIIVLSGLGENKDTKQNTGLSFLPKSWSTKSNQVMTSDLLVVLQAKKVKE